MRVKWEKRDNHQNNTVHTDFLFVVLTSLLTGTAPLQIQEPERRGTHVQFVFRNGGDSRNLQKQKIQTINRLKRTESHNLLFMT